MCFWFYTTAVLYFLGAVVVFIWTEPSRGKEFPSSSEIILWPLWAMIPLVVAFKKGRRK